MDYRDVVERALWTAAQAFLAVLVVADVDTLKAATIAGAGAGISVLKTAVAQRVGK